MGYRISTPTNIILAESKVQSIRERTKFLCKCYLVKVLSNSSLASYNTIEKMYAFLTKNSKNKSLRILNVNILDMFNMDIQTQTNYNIYIFDYRTITTSININIDLGIRLKDCSNPNILLNGYLEETKSHGIFTDGSKSTNDFVGSAYVYPTANVEAG